VTASPVLERVLRVLGDVFPERRGQLSATSKAQDFADWDSMRTIYLAMAIEAEFAVKLTPDEIAGLLSVPIILDLLAARDVT
jgi:acyl carrier protein